MHRISAILLLPLLLACFGPIRADTVHLKNSSVIHGRIVEEPSGLVVQVGATGRIWLSSEDIESWERNDKGIEAAPPPVAPPAPLLGERIATTHVARLNNGGALRGDWVEGDDPGAVSLRIGSIGTYTIPRNQVAKIVAEAGEVRIPATRPRAEPTPPPPSPEPTFEEIVAALAAEVVDRHYSSGWGAPMAVGAEDEIAEAVRELTRQRTRNRVRAEGELRGWGAAALPFLRTVTNHPLDLTRRSAMRLVRDAGAWEGAPLAIASLDDPDPFVRDLAEEAVQGILGVAIPKDARALTASDYWLLWLDAEARRLEAELTETLRTFLAVEESAKE